MTSARKSLIKLLILWLIGGIVYYVIEILWRGYSHPSMFILGGLCFILIGGINNWFPWSLGLLWQSLIGAVVVTIAELLAGLIVNVWFKWGVWDYSTLPINLFGQVCLYYTILWIPLSTFAIWLDDFLRHVLFNEKKPHYTLF